ncbi:MAG: peptide ABC transporter substrate-binding protein [Kiritimatiellaceae bacterium]|nr:peptide ABC transporter substrate-binding protein [Kiritimatiellaceae bacterium]
MGNQTKTLHIGNLSEPKELDPHIVTGLSEGNIIAALLEGLVSDSPTGGDPVPGVAQRWDISPDQTVYTFHLRPEAKWSNGDPVCADDFVFSYRRILSPNLGSPYADMLHLLKNGKAYNEGTITDFDQVGVKALDAHTLQLTLEAPTPAFLARLNHWSWFPVHPPTILAQGAIDQLGTSWTQPGRFVGNGPFVLATWKQNQSIGVVKNSNYWDAANVQLNAIQFYPIYDHKIEERSFLAGQLHITGTIPLERVAHYQKTQPEQVRITPYLRSYYYLLNATKPPLNDPRVRKALALAIDRTAIVKYVTRSGEEPAHSFTPPHIGSYTPPTIPSFDPAEAKRLLAEAGYPNGAGFPALSLLFHTSDLHTRIAEVIQQMWKDNLGIDIRLENVEWKVYQSRRKERSFEIARAEWVADYVDPSSFLDIWQTGGGNNHVDWSSPDYDALIRTAGHTTDATQRMNCFRQAEEILLNDLPIIPLIFLPSKSLVQPSVKGWNPSVLDRHPYKYVRLESP